MEDSDGAVNWVAGDKKRANCANIFYEPRLKTCKIGFGRNDLIFISRFSFRDLLILLFFLVKLFHHLALAFTMHFRFGLIHTIFYKTGPVGKIIQNYK